ncbi:MAG: hypothetical protein AAFQ15_09230 [Pseudomonadota bacterium]
MRSALLATAVAFLSFPSAMAEADAALPLGPGSALYWVCHYDGSNDRYSEKVIAEGEDFKVFLNDAQELGGGPENYYALFSGIDYRLCDAEMPTTEEREAISALWPLEAGKTAAIFATSDNPASVQVGNATELFVMGKYRSAHSVTIDYQNNEETEDETIVVLNDTHLTALIEWAENSRDTLLLVTKPRPDKNFDLSEGAIGTCAALLTDTEN